MPPSRPAANEDRLPWLEPYRETIAQKRREVRRAHGGLVAFAGALAVLFAAGSGYWIGQRDRTPQVGRSDTVAVAPPKQEVIAPAAEPEAPPVQEVAEATPAKPEAIRATPSKRMAKRPVRGKIRTAGIENRRLRAVTAAQERPAPRRAPVVNRWPRMPSPGPAGQVIQLGAFSNPARAHVAYRERIARYPALGRMPRVVVPVITRPRGQILYVLRLGTTSRQESRTVCRNLKASGDHCLVIG